MFRTNIHGVPKFLLHHKLEPKETEISVVRTRDLSQKISGSHTSQNYIYVLYSVCKGRVFLKCQVDPVFLNRNLSLVTTIHATENGH